MVRPGLRLLAMQKNNKKLNESENSVKGIEYKGTLKPLTEEDSNFIKENNLIEEDLNG